jgi:hypothetical protein
MRQPTFNKYFAKEFNNFPCLIMPAASLDFIIEIIPN